MVIKETLPTLIVTQSNISWYHIQHNGAKGSWLVSIETQKPDPGRYKTIIVRSSPNQTARHVFKHIYSVSMYSILRLQYRKVVPTFMSYIGMNYNYMKLPPIAILHSQYCFTQTLISLFVSWYFSQIRSEEVNQDISILKIRSCVLFCYHRRILHKYFITIFHVQSYMILSRLILQTCLEAIVLRQVVT